MKPYLLSLFIVILMMLSVPTKSMGENDVYIYKSNTISKLIESQNSIDLFKGFKGKMDRKELASRLTKPERQNSCLFHTTHLQDLIDFYSTDCKLFSHSTHQSKTIIVYSNEA